MTPVREFTLRAVVAGVVLGIVFGAANAYLGLRVGLTISASIPAAVMTVAAFRALRLRPSILETNLSQTVGSASTALATGTIFTIPALFPWGMVPPYLQVVALCFLGGVLGLAAMIPLRKLLIVDSAAELPYPEGTACAEVLRATASDGSGSAWIFRGMALGAAIKLLVSLAFLVPSGLSAALPVLPKAELAIELAPALVGVGFILGYRQSAVIVAGSLISSLVLIPLIAWIGAALPAPLYPETQRLVAQMSGGDLWSRYVRYIGAGAVAVAGSAARACRPTATCRRGSSSEPSRWCRWRVFSCRGSSPGTWARCLARSVPWAWRSSACSSSRSPPASWGWWASRRSPLRASRWSRCSAWRGSSPRRDGRAAAPGRPCSPWAPSWPSPPRRRGTSRRTSRRDIWWAQRRRGSSSGSSSARRARAGPSRPPCCCSAAPGRSARAICPRRRPC